MHAEERLGSREDAEGAWSAARALVSGAPEEISRVWIWGLAMYASDGFEPRRRIHEVRYTMHTS